MFFIDVGRYLAHYANLICLNIEDDRSQSMSTISIFTPSNCYHSFMVKRVIFHFAEATIVK